MQTEEISPEALDGTPILNSQSDIEMTVKEEIEHPVEIAEKTNVLLNECMSSESTSQFTVIDELHRSFEDTTIGHRFNSPIDNIKQIPITLPRDRVLENNTHEVCASTSTLPQVVTSTNTSPSSQPKNEKERGRGKRRSRWKLKFHHQALPPEYLDHYEASMAQQAAAAAATKPVNKADNKNKGSGSLASKPSSSQAKSPAVDKTDKLMLPSTQCFIKIEQETSKFDVPSSSSSSISDNNGVMDHLHILPIQTLSISDDNEHNAKIQEEISIINEKTNLFSGKTHLNNERFITGKGLLGSLLTSTITSDINNRVPNENERKRKSVIMAPSSGNNSNSTVSRPPSPSNNSGACNSKVRNYEDLPYMGEITLDNMKPRRGRKPKKADICHLIYKNYGTTVFPATPTKNNVMDNEEWTKRKASDTLQSSAAVPSINLPEIRLKQENISEPSLKCKPFETLKQCPPVSHSDVQNRIISSLLEKRLMTSQEGKKATYSNECFPSNHSNFERNEDLTIHNNDSWNVNCKRGTTVSDEPLNLCVKDLNQLKIRLLRKHGNFYEPRANDIIIKSEPPSPNNNQGTDICELQNGSTRLVDETDSIENVRSQMNPLLHKNKSDPNCESINFPPSDCSGTTTPTHLPEEPGSSSNTSLPGGYIYWPSAGVFVHPMALQSQFLYYQKMGAIPLLPLSPAEPQNFMQSHVPHVNLISHMNATMPQSPSVSISKSNQKKELKSSVNKTLIPKAFSMMMDTSPKTTSLTPSSEIPFSRLKRLAPLGNPPNSTVPTKRKRSAIFIPPMPSENSTNPTTEVSICKFKFTGGAKPSLQEKKMLSVDSGGNFRYYSGTGDKSMRGYEFFPRETLQQSGATGGTSAEQFLAASTVSSSEKVLGHTAVNFIPDENKTLCLQHIPGATEHVSKVEAVNTSIDPENQIGSSGSKNFEQQTPSGCVRKKSDFLTKGRKVSVSGESEQFGSIYKEDEQCTNHQVRIRRKRKTRKSLAREKLEQTFKEKGFLIQTQQLESAEGATYCKFRQLRKFTRYLFRSWKDYLPGNVREMSVAAGVAGPETSPTSDVGQAESEVDGELSCSNSPTPSVQHVTENSKSFPSI